MNQHRLRLSSLGLNIVQFAQVVALACLVALSGAHAQGTFEFVAVTPDKVRWGACGPLGLGVACNPAQTATVTVHITMLQSKSGTPSFSVVLPDPKNVNQNGAQPISASAISKSKSGTGTVTYTVSFPIARSQQGLSGFITASLAGAFAQRALNLTKTRALDVTTLFGNAFGFSSTPVASWLMVMVGLVILAVNFGLRYKLPNSEVEGQQLTVYDGVLGKPEWTVTASWATNLTASASLINLTGIVGFFDKAAPLLLGKESYQLLTILFGSMVIFGGALLALTVRRYKFNPPILEDLDFSARVNPDLKGHETLLYIARMLRGEYWAQHPSVAEGTMNFVGRYVLTNAILAGAVFGQVAVLGLLLLELAFSGILPAWMLLPGLGVAVSLCWIGLRYVFWSTLKQLRTDGFKIKSGMLDPATGDVNAPKDTPAEPENVQKIQMMQSKSRRVNSLL